jgi:hypothetical protein
LFLCLVSRCILYEIIAGKSLLGGKERDREGGREGERESERGEREREREGERERERNCAKTSK